MKRLIHAQQGTGAILIDDIDDGLPNKTAHRLGSTADPNAVAKDGYANAPKQGSYVPYAKKTDSTVKGYLDLQETTRVTFSAERGKIAGFLRAGKISVVDLVASDLTAPTTSSAAIDTPATGDVTIAGTGFLSVSPEVTTVIFAGTGVGSKKTLTSAQIVTGGGSVGATSIVIKAASVAGLVVGDTVKVRANAKTTAARAVA